MSNHSEQSNPLKQMREKLAGRKGPEYWRSLEELAGTDEFQKFVDDEFPNRSSIMEALKVDRRKFLTLMGSSMALAGLAGCRFMPAEKIVPYVQPPEDEVLGLPLFYATAAAVSGYAVGVLVESHEGRPTKIEGNPAHPASLGATDAITQASLLGLYDPERSQNVMNQGEVGTWEDFFSAARTMLANQRATGGAGLRILTETITSPTLASQIAAFQKLYPGAKWYQYEPTGRHNTRAGAQAAFGRPVNTIYHFDKAARIVSLDADFLMGMPGSVRYAHDFADRRRVRKGTQDIVRLYSIESTPTITGAMADHRLPVRALDVETYARALASRLGVGAAAPATPSDPWLDALVRDLGAHRQASVVVAGEEQPAAVHALAHAMNQALGAVGSTVTYTEPVEARPTDQMAGLKELVGDMQAGKVQALLILGGNPAYTAPVDVDFAGALARVPFSAHLSQHDDETSGRCTWHLPESHYLETWSDARAYDGTTSIVQPLIQPLYATRSSHELLAALMNQPARGYDIVRATWQTRMAGAAAGVAAAPSTAFDNTWRKALNDGVIPNTAAKPVSVGAAAVPPAGPPPPQGIEIIFRPDPQILDGRFANNPWLQELPRPLTKLTWDNAALMGPAMAVRMGLAPQQKAYEASNRVVELKYAGRSIKAPLFVLPGHPDNSITVHLGWGRTRGGTVLKDRGFNAYALRTSDAPAFGAGLEVRQTGDSYQLVATHYHNSIDTQGRELVVNRTLAQYRDSGYQPLKDEHTEIPTESIFQTPPDHVKYDGYRWAMSIDNNVCIGCNACAQACQAENNIPVVGKDQVSRGREMNWIRIDRYYRGTTEKDLENPVTFFEPVPCMHCEMAPCEPVCPVGATVHSHEGLNQMVYNRCVGTRYCSNNCPYKVRRFNFYKFTAGQPNNAPGNYDNPTYKLMANPNVTVRGRGVMEKCSYCVQRINAARIQAKEENRLIRDGEIQTACQQACPTRAIVFGSIHEAGTEVSKLKAEPADYALLGELNTRPRTSYLAKFRNPNPEIETEKTVG